MKSLPNTWCRTAFELGALLVLCIDLAGCGGDAPGASHAPTAPAASTANLPVTVSVPADLGAIPAGTTVQITATVGNDPANGGVKWTVACPSAPCGTVSPTTTASGAAVTYSAPALSPPAYLQVNIVATSVTDAAVTATTKVTVAGGATISPIEFGSSTVLAGATTYMAATVANDPANRGVAWSLSCATAPCGTLSSVTTASGEHVTYTAPTAVPPANLAVTVTASAVSAPASHLSRTLTVPTLAISVDPKSAYLVASSTSRFTARVNYPAPADLNISWAVTCGANDCGSVSPEASLTGEDVWYTAPASPPSVNLTVTLTVSSVGASAVQGIATLTVAAVAVGVTPVTALVPLNAEVEFVGHVGYDPTGGGVAWTLMQGRANCSGVCGSLLPSATANGAAARFTAPNVLPSTPMVSVTATSIADPTKSASALVKLTSGSVELVPTAMHFVKVKHGHEECCFPPPQKATLTNTGLTPLTINSITIGGTNPKSFRQSNTCGASVAPGRSCVITVQWGADGTAVLSISDSSPDSPQLLQLSATRSYRVTPAMRAALAGQAVVTSPLPSGRATVGTQTLYLVDPTRADPYSSGATSRELPVRFWYPASVEGGCIAASYTSSQVWSYFATLVGVPFPKVSTHSCLNAPIATGRYPVVVISHGFTGTFTDYTFLAEDLASRGYVVASVNHTYEATAVEFPDGRLEKSVFGSHLTAYTRTDLGALGFAVSVRLDDLRFVLDELTRLNGKNGRFADRLDLSQIALAGHSLGGLTTLRALASEPRFKVGVLLDSLVPPHLDTPVQQPVLTLAAGRERRNEDDCRLWEALRGPRSAVNVEGAEHLAFSDAVWLVKGLVSTGGSSADQAIAAIREQVATFLDSNLKLQATGSLPTVPPVSGSGVGATRAQALCHPL